MPLTAVVSGMVERSDGERETDPSPAATRGDGDASRSADSIEHRYSIVEDTAIFVALGDEGCRCILRCLLDGPRTVKEMSERCSMSTSTVYRKMNALREASLVRKHTKVSTEGKHASEYAVCVDRVAIDITRSGDEVSTSTESETDRPAGADAP